MQHELMQYNVTVSFAHCRPPDAGAKGPVRGSGVLSCLALVVCL